MRRILFCALLLISCLQCFAQQSETEIRLSIRSDPKTFDPLLALDDASEAVRYMTGGVLLRFDRAAHQMAPELAQSWRVRDDGRKIDFVLRKGIRFSDGTAFDSADVAATVRRVNDRMYVRVSQTPFEARRELSP